MPLAITLVSPRDPRAAALLAESHALMDSLFPPETNAYLDVEALCDPTITFYGAEEDGELLGCAALARKDGYGEVKSMFVAPVARGIGVARRLLEHLEAEAESEGLYFCASRQATSLRRLFRFTNAKATPGASPSGATRPTDPACSTKRRSAPHPDQPLVHSSVASPPRRSLM